MNSADYLESAGPTFASGFGAVNARRAAEIVTGQQFYASNASPKISARMLQITIPEHINGKNIAQLKVMLYWHDAPTEPYAASALVNNLDLTVDSGGVQHLP